MANRILKYFDISLILGILFGLFTAYLLDTAWPSLMQIFS